MGLRGLVGVMVAAMVLVGPGVAADKKAETKAPRDCGAKTSCDEARYYLATCGVSRLDRDGDGIPGESLCKGKARR